MHYSDAAVTVAEPVVDEDSSRLTRVLFSAIDAKFEEDPS